MGEQRTQLVSLAQDQPLEQSALLKKGPKGHNGRVAS